MFRRRFAAKNMGNVFPQECLAKLCAKNLGENCFLWIWKESSLRGRRKTCFLAHLAETFLYSGEEFR